MNALHNTTPHLAEKFDPPNPMAKFEEEILAMDKEERLQAKLTGATIHKKSDDALIGRIETVWITKGPELLCKLEVPCPESESSTGHKTKTVLLQKIDGTYYCQVEKNKPWVQVTLKRSICNHIERAVDTLDHAFYFSCVGQAFIKIFGDD